MVGLIEIKRTYGEAGMMLLLLADSKNDADCCMEVSAGGGDVLRAKKLALLLGD